MEIMMTSQTRLLGAALLFALASLPVSAGGPVTPVEEPMIAPIADVQDWQGLHFGIAASRPNGDNFFAERGESAASNPDDFSGTFPTVSAGYDWQRGNLVYGVALAISSGEITANPTTSVNFF
ncbi:hypothetical protein [Tabrizicola sp.]|uniref:hypothetical protein n=1 Tax=Tabrizicola sp. TaxID=2005166 RepID=UPI002622A032|nr:hypothetical protein [Tabrizicola sp.]MDM7931063.1 hypothetical protein [Tabrizicola sp.]